MLFAYSEPTLRPAVELAAFIERAVVLVLAAFLLVRRRESIASARLDRTQIA